MWKFIIVAYLSAGTLLGAVTDHMYHRECPADPHLGVMEYLTAAELWPFWLVAATLSNEPRRGCLVNGIEE